MNATCAACGSPVTYKTISTATYEEPNAKMRTPDRCTNRSCINSNPANHTFGWVND